ncbi:type II toxin-antitoxin system mRNA interferase toxin, RelE/StbE family [Photobacterium phosphoreum]|nr:type II toxin-antitoxin system RelE/ParE family toxin [Photobacterium phosphoreum]PSW20366.1 type II toxin-antitoxin system mRNA interferase toxin, RelE/StbE family [Photobacterium phosphoreum]
MDSEVKKHFKNKLSKVLENPKIEANKLRDLPDCYKIKLRKSGHRLIYQVQDSRVVVFVVAIGKRDKLKAYKDASNRV